MTKRSLLGCQILGALPGSAPRVNQTSRQRLSARGMVTAELAIGLLTATMVTVVLCWGVNLLSISTQCADVAAQIARAEARADKAATAIARQHLPAGAAVTVDITQTEVRVRVELVVRLGHLLSLPVSGRAVMPREPR